MRKFFSIALALCLLVGSFALAEAATELGYVTCDLGDFTIDIPEDMMGTLSDEKQENQYFFMFYEDYDPNADFHASLNCIWSDTYRNLESMNNQLMASSIVATVCAQMSAQGLEVKNGTLLGVSMEDLGGKQALVLVYSCDVDYSSLGTDYQTTVYCLQAMVSEEGLGQYTFTLTTEDINAVPRLDNIMDSLKWK